MVEKNAEKRPSATEALAFPIVARSLEVHFSFIRKTRSVVVITVQCSNAYTVYYDYMFYVI